MALAPPTAGPPNATVAAMFNTNNAFGFRWLVSWSVDALYNPYNGTVVLGINR